MVKNARRMGKCIVKDSRGMELVIGQGFAGGDQEFE